EMPNHISSAMRVRSLLSCACAAVLAVSSVAPAEEPDVPAAERAARLEQTKRVLDALHVHATPGRKDAPVKRIDEPVLRYTDNTRLTTDSSLWIFGAAGRPVAIVAIEHYPKGADAKRWICEVASLSNERISVEYGRDI